ncbi:MAG: sulfite exporter TauE/SafE family protein [Pirellula sp.]
MPYHESHWWLCLCVALIAWLYASVGHAGASGYIAVMSLFGIAATEIKPMALVLNILVASVASIQFYRAGHFSWKLFGPFAVTAVPMAFLGGRLSLPSQWLQTLLGLILASSALWFLRPTPDVEIAKTPSIGIALLVGAAIGLLAGLTGTGGGIYLTPVLLMMHWSKTKTASAVSAVFILLNSISGLAGLWSGGGGIPLDVWPLLISVFLGGSVGATLGSYRLPVRAVRFLLAVVLLVAATKLLFT